MEKMMQMMMMMQMMQMMQGMQGMQGMPGKAVEKGNAGGKGKGPKEINPLKVFVSGLGEFSSEESVRATFLQFGVVTEVKMMTMPDKQGQRYCFVSFADKEAAKTCCSTGVVLDGTPVECKPAEANNKEKPGDWYCPMCGDLVFAKRQSCNMCGYGGGIPGAAQAAGGLGGKPGDWVCSTCGDTVFSYRQACNKCGAPRAGNANRIGTKPGDWTCPGCGDLVFASKTACSMCKTPKPEGAGLAGGGGGGAADFAAAVKGQGKGKMNPGMAAMLGAIGAPY
eukprot:gnl/TRDRNA2_/TRDRNA2_175757_c0_seq7.p1 gnl/TRDRNA2_/TRDRNA2_175757_c0~~gnl/TRDRNA2_/TRDRNA2_175757_c0_seq7.p1  ORF type:complete len:296 (+),score=66.01 gnl/TRDRNA2_/TRDRNA2_175757_c0_seq7:51-890(+)